MSESTEFASWQLAPEIVRTADGVFSVLPNDAIGAHLMGGQRWETHLTTIIQAMVPQGAHAVDAGANIGYTSTILGKHIGPSGRVYAIEPLRLTYLQLCTNVYLNGLTNVYPLHFALGDQNDCFVTMQPVDYFAEHVNIMNSSIGEGGDRVIMKTIDALGIPRLDFLKVDVQGLEVLVLRGARDTITRCKPALMAIEIEGPQLKKFGFGPDQVVDEILALGYVLLWIKNDFPVDFICVPRSDCAAAKGTLESLLPYPIEVVDK